MNYSSSLAKSTIRQCQAEVKAVHYNYSGGFMIKGAKFPFIDIYYIDYHRDYVNNFTDVITIKAIMDTTSYYRDVLNNIDDLEVYIHRRQMAENSTLFLLGGRADSKTYKAIIPNPPVRGLGGNSGLDQAVIENPEQSATTIEIQLVDKNAIDIKMAKWAGMLEQTKPSEALAMVLSGGLEDYGVEQVQIAEPDVTDSRQIIIPQGTNIKDCASYLQQNYGIYNFGIGSYKSDKTWFIYPLYNGKRYDKEYYKMSITIVRKEDVQIEVPRTYVVNNGNLIWYCVSDLKVEKNASIDQLNAGTGFYVNSPENNRGPNLNALGPNKMEMDGSQGMNSFSVIDRKDGLNNNIRLPENTQNLAKHVSALYSNKGHYIELQWRYANYDLLYPGMPVKIVYTDNGIVEQYGTLHECHATINRVGEYVGEAPYECHVTMRIFVSDV